MSLLKSLARRVAPDLFIAAKSAKRELNLRRASSIPTPYGFQLSGSAAQARAEFEREAISAALEQFRTADVFIDIGANVGLYTLLALSQGVRTIAVEPARENLRHLYRNPLDNDQRDVTLFPVALSQTPGLLELYNEGTAASPIPGWAAGPPEPSEVVPTMTLGQLFAACGIRGESVFLKMDVEGAEATVLAGAADVLEREAPTAWLVENDWQTHHPDGENPAYLQVFEAFLSRGYLCHSVLTGRPVESAEDGRRGQMPGDHNYLFTRPA